MLHYKQPTHVQRKNSFSQNLTAQVFYPYPAA